MGTKKHFNVNEAKVIGEKLKQQERRAVIALS